MKFLTHSLVALMLAIGLAPDASAAVTSLAYWRFGENDPGAVNGGIATSTANQLGGTMTLGNSPRYNNDIAASAATIGSTLGLRFNGTSYGSSALVSTLTDNFGLELWVKPADANSTQCLAYNGNPGANGWGLYLFNGQFCGLYGGVSLFPVTPADTNAWTHLALVRNNGTTVFYVNSVPAFTNNPVPNVPAGIFAVAAQPPTLNAELFNGALDEVRVFSFAPGAFSTSDLLIPPVVITTADSGPGSLRDAVAIAKTGATITFAPNLSGQTILLTNGAILMNKNFNLDASALAGGIIIDGNHTGNSRVFDSVSGIINVFTALTITNGAAPLGGGIFSRGTLTLNRCAVVGNSASSGGGLYNQGVLTVNNSTLANNSGGNGGGIYNSGATLTVNNSTIASNSGNAGAGIYNIDTLNNIGTLNLANSIVCNNTAPNDPNIFGGISSGANNLVDANPLLAPLGNYGGPTLTMPPLPGSPAIDAGAPTALTTDQRGFARVVGAAVDIGAVEWQVTPASLSVVNTNVDIVDAIDSGFVSLRKAVTYASANATITFAPNLSGQTILLTNGGILMSKSFNLDASSLAGGIVIDGNHTSRVFDSVAGITNVFTALTIASGATGQFVGGGGIRSRGTLTLNRCAVIGNLAGLGGGIYNEGVLTVNNSTLANNNAEYGGGIYNNGGTLTFNNTTVANNSCGYVGGGINNFGTLNLANSIVCNNSAEDLPNISGSISSGANNLVNTNALLAPLGNYGGPTLTMPPLRGSPAINAGAPTTLTTDQRGFARLVGAAVDIGAVEGVYVANYAGPGLLKNATKLGNGSFQFSFTNYSDMSLTVWASTNVALPVAQWSNLGVPTELPAGTFTFTDPQATNSPQRFYRVTSP